VKIAEAILLSLEERAALDKWTAGQRVLLRLVQRAQIIRKAAQGLLSKDIARTLHISRPTVQLWRQRFLALRLPELEKDAPHPGRIPRIPSFTA
jgi:FixJ family two-component response regulator